MHEADERPLSEDALRELLRNVYVAPVQHADVIASHPPGEIFMSDGIYQRILGRPKVEGTFEIRGNEVCVQVASSNRLCRQVIAHANGTYSLIGPTDGSVVLATITPLR